MKQVHLERLGHMRSKRFDRSHSSRIKNDAANRTKQLVIGTRPACSVNKNYARQICPLHFQKPRNACVVPLQKIAHCLGLSVRQRHGVLTAQIGERTLSLGLYIKVSVVVRKLFKLEWSCVQIKLNGFYPRCRLCEVSQLGGGCFDANGKWKEWDTTRGPKIRAIWRTQKRVRPSISKQQGCTICGPKNGPAGTRR